MRTLGFAFLLMFTASSADAMDAARLLPELVWEKRVLLVFAPDLGNAEFRRQNAVLEAAGDGLMDRDMTVIRAFANNYLSVDDRGYEQPATSYYRRFVVKPGEFRVILVGKDGTIKLDRDRFVDDGDLFALIDSMPMRRHEMRQDGLM